MMRIYGLATAALLAAVRSELSQPHRTPSDSHAADDRQQTPIAGRKNEWSEPFHPTAADMAAIEKAEARRQRRLERNRRLAAKSTSLQETGE